MTSALLYDRLQFAFTATFHYLFPQLTMGLALLLLYLRSRVLLTGDEHYEEVADFWTKIFALNFGFGVVTGIPLEFQFGTNWARFSNYAGGVIGQTLAMEGVFAFFLESSFLGILLFRKRFSRRVQWFATLMLFLGTWLSGYFILATNAWMQHPVAYQVAADGRVFVTSLSGLLTNPWLFWQFAHNMTATVVTASCVVAAVGAYYLLCGQYLPHAKTFLRTGVVAGAIASGLMIFPTGHGNADQVFKYQPVKGAAFEGLFTTEREAGLYLIGQPNLETMTIDNPIEIPGALSILVYKDLYAKVKGLDAFPRDEWPDNIPLLYYAYHVMAGLGTIFVLLFGVALARFVAGLAVRHEVAAVVADVVCSVPIHCHVCWVDDRRAGAATLAGVWPLAYVAGHFAARAFGECPLYLDRVFGIVSAARLCCLSCLSAKSFDRGLPRSTCRQRPFLMEQAIKWKQKPRGLSSSP